MSATAHAYDPAATVRSYLVVFGILMLGTALTVVAAFHDFGAWNNVIALAIAITKAGCVVAIFMHARHASNLVYFCIFGSLFFLSLMLYFPLIDLLSRNWLVVGK